MKFSKKTEYAIRALVEMRRREGEGAGWLQISVVAQATHIPEKFLEQILLSLRNGGLLKSKRGIDGGYALNVPASELRMDQVVELLDGINTREGNGQGDQEDDVLAVYHEFVKDAQGAFRAALGKHTLQSMVEKVKARKASRVVGAEYQI